MKFADQGFVSAGCSGSDACAQSEADNTVQLIKCVLELPAYA